MAGRVDHRDKKERIENRIPMAWNDMQKFCCRSVAGVHTRTRLEDGFAIWPMPKAIVFLGGSGGARWLPRSLRDQVMINPGSPSAERVCNVGLS